VEKGRGAEKEQIKEKSKDKDKAGNDRDKDNDGDKDEHEHEKQTLGDMIRDWVENSEEQCSKSGCTAKSGEHEVRYVHGGVKVTINVSGGDRTGVRDNDEEALRDKQNASKRDHSIIKMWDTCAVCNAHTKKSIMSDGT
jgi:1-phosphatidylinositol-3-phosphate 5-kinase